MALLPATSRKDKNLKLQVQFFTKKRQFKVFLQFNNSKAAGKFFGRAFNMRRLPILDEEMNDLFEREMRIYLTKTEDEFAQLAFLKYTEEIKQKHKEALRSS